MKIEVKAILILNVPKPNPNEKVIDIMLGCEMEINKKIESLQMPKTKTKVGGRIHVLEGEQVT